MLTRILLAFGIAIVHLDLTARVLADDILRLHKDDVARLDAAGTVRELKRKYAVLATETGLPMGAQAKVAEMAWRYVAAAAGNTSASVGREFSFYA